jgi:hypothetical protein
MGDELVTNNPIKLVWVKYSGIMGVEAIYPHKSKILVERRICRLRRMDLDRILR